MRLRDGIAIFAFFNVFLLFGYSIFKLLEIALTTQNKQTALIHLAFFLIVEFAIFIYSVEEDEDEGGSQ